MNERFYTLSEDRQNSIINAAYMVFGRNDYRKAPMSEIADAGGISKALLFHYFENKIGLYMFLWEKAIALSAANMQEYHVYETDDFFEMMERSLTAKCQLMRRYPYLSLFCIKAYYEEEEEVRKRIVTSFSEAKQHAFEKVAEHVKGTGVREGFTLEEVYREILYASDGFLLGEYRAGHPDPDRIEAEYRTMIGFWRRAFGR